MFLLRRKSDGKFWRNRASFSAWRDEAHQAEWVDDPGLCRPFATRGGAMHSRACYGRSPLKRPIGNNRRHWDDYHAERNKWHDPKNAPARKAYWEESFEVVPVEIRKIT